MLYTNIHLCAYNVYNVYYPYEYINAQIEYMKYLFIHLKFESTIPINTFQSQSSSPTHGLLSHGGSERLRQ